MAFKSSRSARPHERPSFQASSHQGHCSHQEAKTQQTTQPQNASRAPPTPTPTRGPLTRVSASGTGPKLYIEPPPLLRRETFWSRGLFRSMPFSRPAPARPVGKLYLCKSLRLPLFGLDLYGHKACRSTAWCQCAERSLKTFCIHQLLQFLGSRPKPALYPALQGACFRPRSTKAEQAVATAQSSAPLPWPLCSSSGKRPSGVFRSDLLSKPSSLCVDLWLTQALGRMCVTDVALSTAKLNSGLGRPTHSFGPHLALVGGHEFHCPLFAVLSFDIQQPAAEQCFYCPK